jgi:hypothetical protein
MGADLHTEWVSIWVGIRTQGVDLETGQIKVRISGSSRIIGIVSNKTSPDGLVIAFSSDYVRSLIDLHVKKIRPESKGK